MSDSFTLEYTNIKITFQVGVVVNYSHFCLLVDEVSEWHIFEHILGGVFDLFCPTNVPNNAEGKGCWEETLFVSFGPFRVHLRPMEPVEESKNWRTVHFSALDESCIWEFEPSGAVRRTPG